MSDHSGAVFNNLCRKVPRNPRSNQPSPVYEQKFLNDLKNRSRKLSIESNEIMKSKKSFEESERETVKSFLEFYDSIPEYDEVNHLSNKEFYRKLENLKEKQKCYNDYIHNKLKYETKDTVWIEDYKKLNFNDDKDKGRPKKRKPNIKSFCSTPTLNKSPNLRKHLDDVESISSLEKEITNNPPSRRSVRIETPSEKLSVEGTPEPLSRPKSRAHFSPVSSKNEWDDSSITDFKLDTDCDLDTKRETPLQTKSAPASPGRSKPSVGWKDAGITIPKPFQMTVRDEENKIIEELIIEDKKKDEEKPELFKAHPIPIESQIPLFDKIMADQERKNFLVRERRKAVLQAQMRPFSFQQRDEEIQAITKRLSKSSPSIFLEDVPIKVKKFKAKPVPKSLFSNYIYKKMHEDEFYRALQKKIRAEEMLRAASLPPSMAKREKYKPKYDVCPRSYRDFGLEDKSEKKTSKKSDSLKLMEERYAQELEDLKDELLSTSSKSYKPKSHQKYEKKNKRSFRSSSASSKSTDRTLSSLALPSVSRSNLAAVLRIESARKRQENEMCRKLEEAKLKEEARWKEKILRMKPIWQTLAYSNEEDLAMRLQLRRDEEKLRKEEHRLRMQLMLGRVSQQPTLFERQSQIKYPRTKEELISSLHHHCGSKKSNPRRCVSDLGERRPKKKDQSIKAFFDEYSKDETLESKGSYPEEKEQCDSLNSIETDKGDSA